MALSFIGCVLLLLFLLSPLSLTTCTENLYRSSLILMFDTGAFSLVLTQLPQRSSFRMVGVCPLLVANASLTPCTTSSILYGYRVAKVSPVSHPCLSLLVKRKKMKHDGCKMSLRSYVRERIYSCGLFRCLPTDHPIPSEHAPHTMLITCCRAPAEFIPPVQEPYQYIIFRASEVKDLAVDEPPPRRSVHDDPAVLGVRVSSSLFIYGYLAMPM